MIAYVVGTKRNRPHRTLAALEHSTNIVQLAPPQEFEVEVVQLQHPEITHHCVYNVRDTTSLRYVVTLAVWVSPWILWLTFSFENMHENHADIDSKLHGFQDKLLNKVLA